MYIILNNFIFGKYKECLPKIKKIENVDSKHKKITFYKLSNFEKTEIENLTNYKIKE